ncbi:MAG TPA: YajQ family cyclic di-GMP-binding protein [Patescibacteria group bacterium]|jgi:uncharacterized protein YajQ (UPF0234 family)|nr:YajQ family cyclic di-GMP-binding protein [Patescibacteria group bacterium]
MATSFSFDIVSDYNLSDVINVIDQANRELINRYDFKGTSASLSFRDNNKTGLTIVGDNQFQIDQVVDLVRKKLAMRGLSQKLLDLSKQPVTSNLKVTQDVEFKKGLDQDKAKKITALIREQFPKLKAQIQGQEIRVSGPKKDELQALMQILEQQDFDFPVSFTNYR